MRPWGASLSLTTTPKVGRVPMPSRSVAHTIFEAGFLPAARRRNITTPGAVEAADGGAHTPGYHTRKVAASDHLPRGDMASRSPPSRVRPTLRSVPDDIGDEEPLTAGGRRRRLSSGRSTGPPHEPIENRRRSAGLSARDGANHQPCAPCRRRPRPAEDSATEPQGRSPRPLTGP